MIPSLKDLRYKLMACVEYLSRECPSVRKDFGIIHLSETTFAGLVVPFRGAKIVFYLNEPCVHSDLLGVFAERVLMSLDQLKKAYSDNTKPSINDSDEANLVLTLMAWKRRNNTPKSQISSHPLHGENMHIEYNWKFSIGDVVRHRAAWDGPRMLITERSLIWTDDGNPSAFYMAEWVSDTGISRVNFRSDEIVPASEKD